MGIVIGAVEKGESIKVFCPLTIPDTEGSYRITFKISSKTGGYICKIWVKIKCVEQLQISDYEESETETSEEVSSKEEKVVEPKKEAFLYQTQMETLQSMGFTDEELVKAVL